MKPPTAAPTPSTSRPIHSHGLPASALLTAAVSGAGASGAALARPASGLFCDSMAFMAVPSRNNSDQFHHKARLRRQDGAFKAFPQPRAADPVQLPFRKLNHS
jgi:hypothetical protein